MKRHSKKLLIFLGCSIFLHILSLVGLQFQAFLPRHSTSEQVEIEIRPPTSPESQSAQIVEQKKQINDEIDDQAKYLSAFNQKVARETKAKNSGTFQNTAAAGAPKTAPAETPAKKEHPEQVERPRRGELPSLASLKPQFQMRPPTQPLIGDQGSDGAASATDDYLKDPELGMQTMLSTREFVYYSYYNRIKEKIRQHWEPTVREKVKMVYRQGRAIASTKDHITQVVITLNNQGELVRVEVITPSGVEDLDAAAVEAFRSAQPFPNPPKGLVEKDGQIRIRWDFVLEAHNSQPRLRRKIAQGGRNASDSSSGL